MFCFRAPSTRLRFGRLVIFQLFLLLWSSNLVRGADAAEEVEFAYQALGRAMRDGRFDDGLAICRLAMALEPGILRHPYNAACCEARLGHPGNALALLQHSVRLGFRDLNLLKTDEDLVSLRDLPEFKRLVSELERGAMVPSAPSAVKNLAPELQDLAGRWVAQSMRNDYDDGSFDRGGVEDYTPLVIRTDAGWSYGTQKGEISISDVSAADLAFMDFKPGDNPRNLPKRKFELRGWAGTVAIGYWRIDESDGKPYRLVLHFRITQPKKGLATWIRARGTDR
jgi:hypothetical protein